jgi:hypothetical protein
MLIGCTCDHDDMGNTRCADFARFHMPFSSRPGWALSPCPWREYDFDVLVNTLRCSQGGYTATCAILCLGEEIERRNNL